MRSVFDSITVETDKKGTPACLNWNGRKFKVSRVLDRWRYVGKWWLFSGGQTRIYFRLEARPVLERQTLAPARTVEVFRQDGQWTLSYFCD